MPNDQETRLGWISSHPWSVNRLPTGGYEVLNAAGSRIGWFEREHDAVFAAAAPDDIADLGRAEGVQDTLQSQVSDLEYEVQELEGKIADTVSEKAVLDAKIEELRGENRGYEGQIAQLEKDLRARAEEIGSLSAVVDEQAAQITSLRGELFTASNQTDALKEMLSKVPDLSAPPPPLDGGAQGEYERRIQSLEGSLEAAHAEIKLLRAAPTHAAPLAQPFADILQAAVAGVKAEYEARIRDMEAVPQSPAVDIIPDDAIVLTAVEYRDLTSALANTSACLASLLGGVDVLVNALGERRGEHVTSPVDTPAPKRRGRPKGSKNKSKESALCPR